MLVISLFILATNHKNVGCGHDHSHDHEHEHGHDCSEEIEHQHGDLNPIVALLIICIPLGIAVGNTQHQLSLEGAAKLSDVDLNPENFQEGGFEPPQ